MKSQNKDISILMYHQFVFSKEQGGKIKLYVLQKRLELQFRILKALGYTTITFEDLNEMGLEKRLSKKYIIITVDDGYKDNYKILFPLLKKHKMKAVIFLTSGVSYNKWTVESYGEKKFDLMGIDELKEMRESGFVEFGGHTLTHPSLTKRSLGVAKKEIEEDYRLFYKKLGYYPITFAYPYGHNNSAVRKIVEETGYKFAVSTDTGTGIISENLYDIRRVAIDDTSIFDFIRKISPKYLIYKGKKQKK